MKAPELKLLELHGDGFNRESKDKTLPTYAFVLSLQRGEENAIRSLYWEHHDALRSLGRHLLGNAHDAEDLVHEVFLAVPRALRSYRGDCSLRTFLSAIMVKRAGRLKRTIKRYHRTLGFVEVADTTRQRDVDHPGLAVERSELSASLAKELSRLPFAQRAVVVLCLVEERPSVEAARILSEFQMPRYGLACSTAVGGYECD